MPVRWTTNAADDFTHVVEQIRADNPAAAHRVAQTIYQGIALLEALPNRGRVGGRNIPVSWCFLRGPISSFTKLSKARYRCSAFATHRRIGRKQRGLSSMRIAVTKNKSPTTEKRSSAPLY